MSGRGTLIAWTDLTANFWMGCQKISDGCRNCYAADLTKNRMGLSLWGPPKTTARQAVKSVLGKVRIESKRVESGVMGEGWPRLVFVGSLMDWAEDHPDADRLRPLIWDTVRRYPRLHFQLLTKRADRIRSLLPEDWGHGYPNVWLGASVENMHVARRADALREIPATVRFISYEPALGPLNGMRLDGLDWILYGGESGPRYRQEDKQWARDMRVRCREQHVAFFHKQSSHRFTERGIELDGEIIREFPYSRLRQRERDAALEMIVDASEIA